MKYQYRKENKNINSDTAYPVPNIKNVKVDINVNIVVKIET
jgi:hypothetical protein